MTRTRSLRLLLLLFALGAALFFYTTHKPPAREALLIQGFAELPEVVPPEGELLEAFKEARPATVQIEIGSSAFAFADTPLGVGTGFFISPDGLLLTAYHVVDPAPDFPGEAFFEALSPKGERYALELVGFDAYRDLALLQAADAENVPYLPLTDETPAVGSEVVAIGNSRGDFLQGRAGEVRRLDVRAVQISFADGTFELSSALAPGDSGGPVVSEAGEVLGVVSYIAFAPRATSSVPEPGLFSLLRTVPSGDGYAAYAVPVAADDDALDALRRGEQQDIPAIGFVAGVQGLREDYDPRSQSGARLGPRPGVVVGALQPGGPAERAGLRSAVQQQVYDSQGVFQGVQTRADVIVAIDGERTPTFEVLQGVLRHKQIGRKVELEVQRGEERLQLRLELGGRRAVFGG